LKAAIETLLVLAAVTASAAFDSTGWLAKREMLTREAERLQAAYSNCVSRVREAAEDVVVPIETFPDGSIKSSVFAKKAVFFLDTGLVWAEGVTVKKQDEEGNVLSQIDAEHCVIDRKTKSGWAEGPAKLRHGTTEFTGEDVYFSSPEGYVSVMRKSRIASKDLKFGGLR